MLRTSYLGTAYYRILQTYLLGPVEKWGLSPNQMTLLGVVTAVLVPLAFLVHPMAGFLLLAISAVSDSLDGLMARHRHQASRFGAFWDSSIDRFSDFFYLLGFWLLLWPHPRRLGATLLMLAALLLTLMISYVKARAEALGIACPSGMMDRVGRIIYLLAWALLLSVLPGSGTTLLWTGFAIYIGLTIATLIHRIQNVRSQLMENETISGKNSDHR
jgi:CDP-diacylglycerol---glycerol-3-phosphate 3-phosphatidyltransferase